MDKEFIVAVSEDIEALELTITDTNTIYIY